MSENRITGSDRWFFLLFALLTAVNVAAVWFNPLDLSPDEAHYFEWSKRIDWGYYSKGPAIAVLIRASTMLFGATPFAVRLPAICCFGFFSILYYVYVRQLVGSKVALASWLASRAMPIFAQMGAVATTDAPAALLWLVALICAHRAVVEEESPYWVGFGAAVGLGVLAKYTVIALYPSIVLLLFLTPHLRRHLVHPAFLAGSIVMLFALFPILKWNAEHGWVNFEHNAEHVAHSSSFHIAPVYFFELIAGQIGLVGPLIMLGIVCGVVVGYREWKQDDRVAALLFFSVIPLALFVCTVSMTKRVYANWPLPIYIGGLVLISYLIANYRIVSPRVTRLIAPAIIFSGVLTAAAHLAFLGFGFGVSANKLPTRKLVGWRHLGESVELAVEQYRKQYRKEPFILVDNYTVASEIAFYAPSALEIYCGNFDGRRMNQYDIWGGWERLRGRDAIIVLDEPFEEPIAKTFFASSDQAAEPILIEYRGSLISRYSVTLGKKYNGVLPPVPDAR